MADNIGVLVDGQLRRFGECNQVFAELEEVDVVRLLGCRNFLKIKKITGGKAMGDWGGIPVSSNHTGKYYVLRFSCSPCVFG